MISKSIKKLSSNEPSLRIAGSEELSDIYFDKYEHVSRGKEDLRIIVESLINAILKEINYDAQLNELSTLYNYCFYSTENEKMYDLLVDNFDSLLDANCRQYVVRIAIASGDKKYMPFYTKLLDHPELPVRFAAQEGIESLK